jgi:hypothetical protein
MRLIGYVARMGKKRSAYRILVGKPDGRRPLGRHRLRWESNIKMDGGMDWIDPAQDRDHDNEPSSSIKFWEILQ